MPPRCLLCLTRVTHSPGLCFSCWEGINFITHPYCNCCGFPFEIPDTHEMKEMLCGACLQDLPDYRFHRSAFCYDEGCKSLILRFKHGDATHLVSLFLNFMINAGQSLIEESEIIIPVPLHWRRLLKRGYNQACKASIILAY